MKKLSSNILLKTLDNSHFEAIQTDRDFTFKEVVEHKGKVEDFYTCVETDKFLTVYDENLNLSADKYFQLSDSGGKVDIKLPIMKAFGEFSMAPEMDIAGKILLTFEEDYSKRKLDLTEAAGQYSYVMIGQDFVSRYLYNTLNYYGKELKNDYYCITPKQYKLLQSMGKCKITIYPNKIVAAVEDKILILEQFKKLLDFNLLDRFFKSNPIAEIEMPQLNFKEIKLFASTDFGIKLKDGSIEVYCDGYRREYQAKSFISREIDSIFYLKDLEYLSGKITFHSEGAFFYAIKKEEDQTVLFVGKEIKHAE